MKYLMLCFAISTVLLCSTASAQEPKRVPPFSRLDAVAGVRANSDEFKQLLDDYKFSKNPKRNNSWGSSFGVFLEPSNNRVVSIGIRPPSSTTNMPTYPGELPKGLKPEDTIESLRRKLGQPNRTQTLDSGTVAMFYDGYHIITIGGKLFEIWLTEVKGTEEPSRDGEIKSPRL